MNMLLQRVLGIAVACLCPLVAVHSASAPSSSPSEWTVHSWGRSLAVHMQEYSGAGFTTLQATATGMVFTNLLSDDALAADSSLLSGSGVALGDADGDGLCDVYLCSLSGQSALFRNTGNWKFENVTARSGAGCAGLVARGATFADVDGDTDLDLLVTTRGAGTRLFQNDGNFRFTDLSTVSGIATNTGATSLALSDIDGDGDLDLYVANFGVGSVLRDGGQVTTRMVGGRMVVVGRHAKRVKLINGQFVEFGEPDTLYLNDGHGRFKPVPWEQGAFLDELGKAVETPWDFGLAVQFRDLNHDRAPDLYVCNDFFTPDRIWINNGKGSFRSIPPDAIRKSSYAAMGVDFADINRDGHMDALIVEMQAMDRRLRARQMTPDTATMPPIPDPADRPQAGRNTLLLNRGDGTFAEIANYAGLAASDWSWMPAFLDVDLDGYEDVLIPNGHPYDLLDLDEIERGKMRDPRTAGRGTLNFPVIQTPNRAFRNQGDLTFKECGAAWGFDALHVSNAMALADLDNDGDLDLVVNCLNVNALVLRNEASSPRIAVRLKGRSGNSQGIGALITVRSKSLPVQSQELVSGGRYQSADDPLRCFAVRPGPIEVKVDWRRGGTTILTNVPANAIIEVAEPTKTTASDRRSVASPHPLFKEHPAADRVSKHHFVDDAAVPDYSAQPLLWRPVGPQGPRVSWSSRGPVTATLNVGDNGLELGPASPRLWRTNLPSAFQNISCVALGDLDADAIPELFVANRALPRRYPEPASGLVLRITSGIWRVDDQLSASLQNVGLINSAIISRATNGYPGHLFLGCEWGPVRAFVAQQGSLREVTEFLGLSEHTGWWQSLALGDFNRDGLPDVAAGNWGLNNHFQSPGHTNPVSIYYGDFSEDGSVQFIEAVYDAPSRKWLPTRDLRALASAMPFTTAAAPTHHAFSESSVEELLGPRAARAKVLRARTLSSMVFLSEGGKFRAAPLPAEAQFSPALDLCAADFDADGHLDLFLAQNYLAVARPAWRQDAGCGLLLKGDGAGAFSAMPSPVSGIRVFAQQTGCAAGDLDSDGFVDLALTQSDGTLRVFHNTGRKRGAAHNKTAPHVSR